MSRVGHKRIECSCGRVIAQCRCIDPRKPVEIRQHPACGFVEPMSADQPCPTCGGTGRVMHPPPNAA